MVELKPYKGSYYLWKYLPSVPLAGVFGGAFLILTTITCFQILRSRYWAGIPLLVGGMLQVIGYGARIACHWNTDQLGLYIIQSTLIIIAPVLYAASLYMVLGRLISSIRAEDLSIIRPTRLTKLFVLGDVFAFLVQGNGAGLTANEKSQKLGQAIITAGLFIQVITFGLFCFVAIIFHRRMNRKGQHFATQSVHIPWKSGLWMLYICSFLIMFRSIFRIVEYIMGMNGYLLRHEWPAYALDAAPMVTVQAVFVLRFPAVFKAPPTVDPNAGFAMVGGPTASRENSQDKMLDSRARM